VIPKSQLERINELYGHGGPEIRNMPPVNTRVRKAGNYHSNDVMHDYLQAQDGKKPLYRP